jgi:hypothetical protein
MDYESVISATNDLIRLNNRCNEIFEETRRNDKEPDFYQRVKPFADEVQVTSEKWLELIGNWIKKENPRYIHLIQCIQTVENLNMIAVQAFYPKTSYNRFKSHYQSVDFQLKNILKHVSDCGHGN